MSEAKPNPTDKSKANNDEDTIERRNYKMMIRLSLSRNLEADPKILDYIADLLTTIVLLMKYLPSDVGTAIFTSITNALPEDKQFEFIVNWMSRMIDKYYKLQSIIGRFAPSSGAGSGDIMSMMMRMLIEERNRQSMMGQSSVQPTQSGSKVKIERNEELEKLLFGDDGESKQ